MKIKFRAWDKKNKAMLKIVEIDFYRNRMYFTIDDKYYGECDLKEVALMQCTGLKDKNGVEIYEGDIVKERSMMKDDMFIIEYIPQKLQYCYVEYVKGLKEKHRREWSFDPASDIEVVGNVWENPEILEHKHD